MVALASLSGLNLSDAYAKLVLGPEGEPDPQAIYSRPRVLALPKGTPISEIAPSQLTVVVATGRKSDPKNEVYFGVVPSSRVTELYAGIDLANLTPAARNKYRSDLVWSYDLDKGNSLVSVRTP